MEAASPRGITLAVAPPHPAPQDVLIRPKRSTLKSRSEVSLARTFKFHNSKREWTGVPIIAANMDTTGTLAMAAALGRHRVITALHKFHSPDEVVAFAAAHPEGLEYVAVSAGTSAGDFSTISKILAAVPAIPNICLDVANGYSEAFVDAVRRTREAFPAHTIIAGNVVTAEMTEELILTGADIVKIGIGPGSVCRTRSQTGVGYPQLSAIMECADAAHGLGGHIVGDGGCTCPGDVAKAFGGGADFVMLGGMFAGHDESGGDIVERDGRTYKLFSGMSSAAAMMKHSGGVAEYRSSEGKVRTIHRLHVARPAEPAHLLAHGPRRRSRCPTAALSRPPSWTCWEACALPARACDAAASCHHCVSCIEQRCEALARVGMSAGMLARPS